MNQYRVKARIAAILEDESLSPQDRIAALQKMYAEVRAEQRTATESAMVDDEDIGAEMIDIENALQELGGEIPAPENKGAATL